VKKILLVVAAAASIIFAPNVASAAFEGNGWYYNNNAGGYEILKLRNDSSGSYLALSGTAAACGPRGVPYARIRAILAANQQSSLPVRWWISNDCGEYVRICIENQRGARACSTYFKEGWE
jgi:hypothetical protein